MRDRAAAGERDGRSSSWREKSAKARGNVRLAHQNFETYNSIINICYFCEISQGAPFWPAGGGAWLVPGEQHAALPSPFRRAAPQIESRTGRRRIAIVRDLPDGRYGLISAWPRKRAKVARFADPNRTTS